MTSLHSRHRCRTAAGFNRWTFRTDVVVPIASAIARATGVFSSP